MTRRTVALALLVLGGGSLVRSADAQFMGRGYGMGGGMGMGGPGMGMGYMGGPGMGYGFGPGMGMGYGSFGGMGGPFAAYPFASMMYGSGPGMYNPLFSMGLTPLAVQGAIGEASLRGPQMAVGVLADPNTPRIPATPGSTVTIATPGQKTYTYKIVTP